MQVHVREWGVVLCEGGGVLVVVEDRTFMRIYQLHPDTSWLKSYLFNDLK